MLPAPDEAPAPAGTPAYRSPEMLTDPAAAGYGTDLWSLGVTMFELVTGRLPFQAKDDRSTAAASKRDAKHLRDAAAASKCLEQTPIDLAAWSDKDIRVVLAQRFKKKVPGKVSRATMVGDLRGILVSGGLALVGQP